MLAVMHQSCPSLTIVVPCYNEGETLPHCLSRLSNLLRKLMASGVVREESHILFVDDGSRDDTWQKIQVAAKTHHPLVHGLKLSRNGGHQIALIAGLSHVKTDICISIDADLQDDITCIPRMIEKYREGKDVIYGVRSDRGSDTFFKRVTANGFYRAMNIMGVQHVANHADFRLLSRKALNALLSHQEQNLYVRGLVPLVGFASDEVFYVRDARIAGKSKYPLHKMLALALEGITSLSVIPLRMIAFVGMVTCIVALIGLAYVFANHFTGRSVTGWSFPEGMLFFLGGFQLFSLGVIGEYIGKIYLETKKRPRFFVDKFI